MPNTKPHRTAVIVAALLAGTALGGCGASLAPASAQGLPPTSPIAVPSATQAGPAMPGFGDLVARVRPAVVTITSTERVQAEAAASPFPPGSEQDRLFRRFYGHGPQGEPGAAAPRTAKALGSGFIVDADGDVVTNNHVVDGASKVVVTLDDGRELPARVVGRDARTDIAVLRVDAGAKLPYLALGDFDRARPGDWVVAMGNPFGLGGSVTAGIVSARGRDIGAGPYDDFLQVDAPINRGNSGGPLFALDGSVVGVNTAIYSPSGGSVGIGFAIPSNLVKQVVAELEAHGHLERGFIGLASQKLDAGMAAALHLPSATGALVAEVQPGGPAARAGLRPGDVVTAVNGVAVQDPRALARQVAAVRPGATASLTVLRDGREQAVQVTAAALPDRRAEADVPEEPSAGGKVGLALAPVSPQVREELHLDEGVSGAVIASVRPGSPAGEAGLKPGDVVQGVGGQAVATPEEAVQAIAAQAVGAQGGTQALALRVLRDGHSLFVAVQPAQG